MVYFTSQGMRWQCIFSDNRNEASFMSIVRLNGEFDRQALPNRGKEWKPWNLRKRAYLLKSIDITPKCRIPHITCLRTCWTYHFSGKKKKRLIQWYFISTSLLHVLVMSPTCKEENANYTSKISISQQYSLDKLWREIKVSQFTISKQLKSLGGKFQWISK